MQQQNFETEVLTRLAVIESKLDNYKEIEDKTNRAYNLSKENYKEIEEIVLVVLTLMFFKYLATRTALSSSSRIFISRSISPRSLSSFF